MDVPDVPAGPAVPEVPDVPDGEGSAAGVAAEVNRGEQPTVDASVVEAAPAEVPVAVEDPPPDTASEKKAVSIHFVTRLLIAMGSTPMPAMLAHVDMDREGKGMILSSLPRLLSYLCPGINDREITHLVASLSVNVPLENDLLPEGMPTLRNHVLNLLSTRAVYWAMRCKITDEPLPADMSDDMPPTSDSGTKILLKNIQQVTALMETRFQQIGADFSQFNPDADDTLDQSGVVSLLHYLIPNLSAAVTTMILVHLDETVAESGRLSLNELYTALKWWTANSDDSPGHIIDQMCKVLSHQDTAGIFQGYTPDAKGRLALQSVLEMSVATCQCVRPRDLTHLKAILTHGAESDGKYTLEELRAILDKSRALLTMYWQERNRRTGETSPYTSVHDGEGHSAASLLQEGAQLGAIMEDVSKRCTDMKKELESHWGNAKPDEKIGLAQVDVVQVVRSCIPQLGAPEALFFTIHLDNTADACMNPSSLETALDWWRKHPAPDTAPEPPVPEPESAPTPTGDEGLHIFECVLKAALKAAGGPWMDFHNLDKDKDNRLDLDEVVDLVQDIKPGAVEKEVVFVATIVDVDPDRNHTVGRDELIMQLQKAWALRREYWKQRVHLSGEPSPIPDLELGEVRNEYVLSLMKRIGVELEQKYETLHQQMTSMSTCDSEHRVHPIELRTALQLVLPDLDLTDLTLIMVHLHEATVSSGSLSAQELVVAIKWWTELEMAMRPETVSSQELPKEVPAVPLPEEGSLVDPNILAILLKALRNPDGQHHFKNADKDLDGRIDVPEVGDLMGMLDLKIMQDKRRDLFFVAALLEAGRHTHFSFAELINELSDCQAVRVQYWKQRCAITNEAMPSIYTDFGSDCEVPSVTEGVVSMLRALEHNQDKFLSMFEQTCALRESGGYLDIADVRGMLGHIFPDAPKTVMRVVLTHLDAAVDGDGTLDPHDVIGALQWWETAASPNPGSGGDLETSASQSAGSKSAEVPDTEQPPEVKGEQSNAAIIEEKAAPIKAASTEEVAPNKNAASTADVGQTPASTALMATTTDDPYNSPTKPPTVADPLLNSSFPSSQVELSADDPFERPV